MQIDTCEVRRWIGDRHAAYRVFYKDDEKCKFMCDELCGDLINLLDDYEDSLSKDMAKNLNKPLTAADVIFNGIKKVI